MDEDLKQIGKVLRDSVHLTNEQMERYLEGSLDLESRKPIEDHLRDCCYCSAELELIREAFQEGESQGVIEDLRSVAKKILRLLPTKRFDYTTFWLGYDRYSLVPAKDHAGFIEVQGLSTSDILRARREDREDPGSKPVAIVSQELPPVVASLSDFQPLGDFQDLEKDDFPESDEDDSAALRAFAPIGLFGAGLALPGSVISFPRKGKKKPKTKLEPILTYDAPSWRVEILREKDSGSIFLRICEQA
jgi:hypothetical protein